jgi:hypothetical protein
MGKTPKEYNLEHWRDEFAALFKQFDKKIGFAKALSRHDQFFGTTEGYWTAKNVKEGKAGLGPTRQAYDALNKYINASGSKSRKLRRQKLVTNQ